MAQDAVLAFLESAEPHVKRIDTHSSIVFLGTDRVLKIKRDIRLPFLDYSSLDKRQTACKAELDVNQPYAPGIYRRVVPITQGRHGLAIDGDGEPVEWAVEMNRFDETAELDHLAARSPIEFDLAEQIADVVALSHSRAQAADGAAWLDSIGALIERNTAQFYTVANLPRATVKQLHDASMHALAVLKPILEVRAHNGCVRRCHGDLHLGNITLIDGKPVLFDAIEFDPAIATTDVLYDLSFVIMDMLHFGQPVAANAIFNRYLARNTPCHFEALGLFPLFLSIRAAIRAHVLFTRSDQQGKDAAVAARARRYFELAVCLIAPAPASIVAIGGPSGTGKSVLSRAVAPSLGPAPGAVIIRSDVLRKAMFHVSELQRLPQSAYSAEATTEVYAALMTKAGSIAAQGHSVVIDAAFLQAGERRGLEAIEPHACSHIGLFLQARLDVRQRRIAARHDDASDATPEIATLQEGVATGDLGWHVIDANDAPSDTLTRAMACITACLEPGPT